MREVAIVVLFAQIVPEIGMFLAIPVCLLDLELGELLKAITLVFFAVVGVVHFVFFEVDLIRFCLQCRQIVSLERHIVGTLLLGRLYS